MPEASPVPAVDAQRVIAAADAIEVRILKNIQARLDAGKPVGEGELKALRKIREKYQDQASGDGVAGELAARPNLNPVCLRWVSVAECAKELGITDRWLRNWVRGAKQCKPAIPYKTEAGKTKVQPAVVYEHIRQHAAKGSPGLRPPAGFVEASSAAAPVDLFADVDLTGNPHELIRKILSDRDLLTGMSEAKMRAVAALAAETGRERERQARMDGAVKSEKVLQMLRALIYVFVNLIDERAMARASALVKYLQAEFAVDVAKSNQAAVGLLADHLRGLAQEDIHALHEELKAQVEGLRLMEDVE